LLLLCVGIFESKMTRATAFCLTALPLVQGVPVHDEGPTSVTDDLNALISRGDDGGVYTGGKGLLLRNPYDSYEHLGEGGFKVLPTTFWSNDIFAPSQMYPGSGGGGNPLCPQDWCDHDATTGDNGPWNYAQTAYVVGSNLGDFFADFDNLQSVDWGWGVFYPTDSNAVDKRCRWLESDGIFDCPGGYISDDGFHTDPSKGGAGYYDAGNPYANPDMGGGAGCHFETWAIDQTDAVNAAGENIVQDKDCQCNYNLKGDDSSWASWKDNWLANAEHKPGFNYEWFSQGKAPSWALDVGMCWVSNLRDMINMQNQIFWSRYEWSSQQEPQSQWGTDGPSNRNYWGWNEIPMPTQKITNPRNWDAIVIKLPAAICGDNGQYDTVQCLLDGHKERLHNDLIQWRNDNYLKPGKDMISERPGSYVVFVREWMDGSGNWFRYFFCENFKLDGKSDGVQIVYRSKDVDGYGACYADDIHSSQEV